MELEDLSLIVLCLLAKPVDPTQLVARAQHAGRLQECNYTIPRAHHAAELGNERICRVHPIFIIIIIIIMI